MVKATKQRIKLRCEGSPVKFDATVIESSPDGRRIKVTFDGPLEDVELQAHGDHRMFSNGRDPAGNPTLDLRNVVTAQYWEVL